MYEPDAHEQSKPRPPRADCCVESKCVTGLRNHYFVGKRLTPDSFVVEQNYLNGRRRLLNRAIHGWGVVYGYELAVRDGGLAIGSGLALDAAGRELVWVEASMEVGDMIPLDTGGKRHDPKQQFAYDTEDCWLLSAHYAEQRVGALTVKDPCDCDRQQWDSICETVRFSLQPWKRSKCCEPPTDDNELSCRCGTGDCCNEGRTTPREDSFVLRGGCRCLCENLTGLTVGVECETLTPIDEPCGRSYVDLRNGVPLACVKVARDGNKGWKLESWIEDCGPRRLVKRLDLLFDLIRGRDLTRIIAIGWTGHRETVGWGEFIKSWGPPADAGKSLTKYSVTFSKAVRKSTVGIDCFAITMFEREREGGWTSPLRVPITGIATKSKQGDPEEHVITATIEVDAAWVKDAIAGYHNRFERKETRVEIVVRGDYILDCNGLAVDANAVGASAVPTGNGTPGGDYFSSFLVVPDESKTYTQGASR